MSEEFVGRAEFNVLKEEVQEIKHDMVESQKLLQAIDKKIDIIDSKIVTADKIEDLKLNPLEKRVTKLEENQTWLRRTIIGTVLTVIAEVIVFVIQIMK